MKAIVTIILFGLVLAAAAQAAEPASDPVLFARDGYRFVVTDCVAEAVKEGRQRVVISVAYEVPEHVRFILLASKSPAGSLIDAFAHQVIDGTTKGRVRLEFERETAVSGFYLRLWRGVGGDSPSGIVCDGAFIDLPLKITPVAHHE